MPISAIFANAHFLKNISVPFLEPWVTRVMEETVGCFAYKHGLKVMTEFGLVGLLIEKNVSQNM
jgi:hypothetical protein